MLQIRDNVNVAARAINDAELVRVAADRLADRDWRWRGAESGD